MVQIMKIKAGDGFLHVRKPTLSGWMEVVRELA